MSLFIKMLFMSALLSSIALCGETPNLDQEGRVIVNGTIYPASGSKLENLHIIADPGIPAIISDGILRLKNVVIESKTRHCVRYSGDNLIITDTQFIGCKLAIGLEKEPDFFATTGRIKFQLGFAEILE